MLQRVGGNWMTDVPIIIIGSAVAMLGAYAGNVLAEWASNFFDRFYWRPRPGELPIGGGEDVVVPG
jgi:hypothetical protein